MNQNMHRQYGSPGLRLNGDLGLGKGLGEESLMSQVRLKAGLVDSVPFPTSCLYREGGTGEGNGSDGASFPLLEPDQKGREAERSSLALWIGTSWLDWRNHRSFSILGHPFWLVCKPLLVLIEVPSWNRA